MTDLLVPIDFSDITSAVLATAARLAKGLDARIALMHVVPGQAASHHKATGEGWQVVDVPATERPEMLQDQGHMPDQRTRTVHLSSDDNAQMLRKQTELQRHEDRLRAQSLTVTAILLSGKPIERILEEAARLQPAFIVLGSHGHGALRHLIMGSVSSGVLRKAHCPVVIVPLPVPFPAP